MRRRGVDVAEHLRDELGDPALVLGVAKAPEQAYRRGLAVGPLERVAQLGFVELAQHSVGARALRHRHPQVDRHERRRVAHAEAI